jgi:MFS family permease
MEQILPAILLIGIGNTIPFVLNFPMLIDLIPQERAGEFVGLGSLLWSVGQPFGALIGGGLADVTGGYRVTFIFAGIMMIAAFLVLQTVRPHSRQLPAPAVLAP